MNVLKKSLLAVALSAALASPSWAAALSFAPASGSVGIGGGVDVDLVISGLAAGEQLGSFDLSVVFNNLLLNLDSYSLGSQLGQGANAFDTSAGALGSGLFNLGQVSFLFDLSTQPSSFTLATLHFTGLSIGDSTLGLNNVTLGDAWGNALSADLGSASLNVVPEPGTYALMLAGLGLAGLTRRRSR